MLKLPTYTEEMKQRIRTRILSRKAAEEMLEMLPLLLSADVTREEVFNALGAIVEKETGRKLVDVDTTGNPFARVMDEDEASAFEKTVIPHQPHKGKKVGDVDPDAWVMMVDNKFNRQLIRYMRSRRFRQRLDGE